MPQKRSPTVSSRTRLTARLHHKSGPIPVLHNLANHGQSWRENGISHDRVVRRVAAPIKAGCPALWDYLEARLEEATHKGFFGA